MFECVWLTILTYHIPNLAFALQLLLYPFDHIVSFLKFEVFLIQIMTRLYYVWMHLANHPHLSYALQDTIRMIISSSRSNSLSVLLDSR